MVAPSRVFRLNRILPLFLFLIAATLIHAEPPKLDYLFPAGGTRGTTITLTLGGELAAWPVSIWSDAPDLVFTPSETKGEVKVQIPDTVPLGAYLIRAYHADGASRPRTFIVDDQSHASEVEPNDDYRKPQKIETTPTLINGRLEKSGDSDSFAINLKAGQWLVAKAESYGIGSPIDPALHVRDANGFRLADAHDTQNLDPLLAFQAPADGTYIVQIDGFAHIPRFDVRLFGSAACVYRLAILTGPYAHYAFPLAVTTGTESDLQLNGWNLPEGEGATRNLKWTAPALPTIPSHDFQFASLTTPLAENHPSVFVSAHPQSIESDDNNTSATATKLAHPFGVSGHIFPAGDEDWYAITLKKSETVRLKVVSASLGFGLDSVVSVHDASGKSLASGDDATATWDAELVWTAPDDAEYFLRVVDRFAIGAKDFAYYLEVTSPAPRIQATVAASLLRLDVGTTATLKLNVTRLDGYAAPLIATATDLPEGVTSTSAAIPEKGGEVTLILDALPTAKAFNGLFRVLILSTDPAAPQVSIAPASLDVELPVGPQIIPRTDKLWLTVVEKKPDPPKEAEAPK